jgi:hypothetical protein
MSQGNKSEATVPTEQIAVWLLGQQLLLTFLRASFAASLAAFSAAR